MGLYHIGYINVIYCGFCELLWAKFLEGYRPRSGVLCGLGSPQMVTISYTVGSGLSD